VATAWIQAHAAELRDIFIDDDRRDRALYDGSCGITPESIAEKRKEYRLRFCTMPEECCEAEEQTD
jgi:hypothetical protein